MLMMGGSSARHQAGRAQPHGLLLAHNGQPYTKQENITTSPDKSCVAVMPGTKLTEHIGSDKAWVWSTMDFASEVQKMELFCIRFASKERVALLSFPQHSKAYLGAQAADCGWPNHRSPFSSDLQKMAMFYLHAVCQHHAPLPPGPYLFSLTLALTPYP